MLLLSWTYSVLFGLFYLKTFNGETNRTGGSVFIKETYRVAKNQGCQNERYIIRFLIHHTFTLIRWWSVVKVCVPGLILFERTQNETGRHFRNWWNRVKTICGWSHCSENFGKYSWTFWDGTGLLSTIWEKSWVVLNVETFPKIGQ